ncbi:MAG: Coenzyme F420 hydrogenase/dehydrogenase, beta subunit C-terminal domain [Promethearchaeati archaeon SRVP18_Atabeyarchaeia-1]
MSEDRSYITCRISDENRGRPVETTIKSLYKALLDGGIVDAFLTFTEKKPGGGMQAVSVEASSDVSSLDYRLLSQYLVVGLPRLLSVPKIIHSQLGGCFDKKVALVARPCEIEALVELSKRNQVSFGNLFIIGLECPGSVSFLDLANAIKKQGIDQSKIESCEITPSEIAVKATSGTIAPLKLGKDVRLRECCTRCGNREPPTCDISISAWRRSPSANPNILIRPVTERGATSIKLAKSQGMLISLSSSDVSEKEQKDSVIRDMEKGADKRLEEQNEELARLEGNKRFAQLKAMLDPCTKCGLCVRACPVCWCKDCILLKKIKTIDPLLLHATRLVHMGDTCVNCGKCDENCPKGIQLSRIFYGFASELGKLTGYKPGLALHQPSQRSGQVILGKT